MKEKNWTDEELAKALLKSIEYKKGITYFDDLGNCKEIKVMDIIDLITRLKCNTKLDSWKNKFLNALKEKEDLQKDYIELDLQARELRTKVDELKEERENMQAVIFALEAEKRKAVKDTAKEIFEWLEKHCFFNGFEIVETYFRERYGVEVE